MTTSPAQIETVRQHAPYRGYALRTVRCSTGLISYNGVLGEREGRRTVLAADVELCKRAIDERERGADSGR
jgi:hypothetical protein